MLHRPAFSQSSTKLIAPAAPVNYGQACMGCAQCITTDPAAAVNAVSTDTKKNKTALDLINGTLVAVCNLAFLCSLRK